MNVHPGNFRKTLLSIAIASVLSACGGGSSDNDDTASNTIDATLSGVASKGIIINGSVTAAELNADKSVKHANVGSATTDSNGAYTLSLNSSYEGGPVKVTVTKTADTTMVCDAVSGCGPRTDGLTDTDSTIDFGEQYKPTNLEMSALLPQLADGAAVSVQITPFTDLAAERALNSTTLDNAAINNANSEVSNLLGGIDILSTPPVDITDPTSLSGASANAQTYAALMAAIAELAPDDANGQPDIQQALDNLAQDFASDGTFSATDTAENADSNNVIALNEIVSQATAAFAQVSATDTSGVLADLEDDVANAGAGGSVDPTPSDSAGDSNVAKAKAFLADLRTWGVTIGGQIDAPSQAFDNQIEMSAMASDMIQNDGTGDAIALGAMALAEYFQGTLTTLTSFSDGMSNSPFSAGTLSQTSTANGVEYKISGGQVTANGDSVTLDMTLLLPADGANSTEISFGIVAISAEGASSKLIVNNGNIKIKLKSSYTIDYAALANGTAAEPAAPTQVDFDFDFATTQKKTQDATTGAFVTANDPITFAGTLKATLYPYTASNGEVIDVVPGSFDASGTVSNTTGDSYDISLNASIPNAANVTPVNTVLTVGSTYSANNNGDYLVSWTNNGTEFSYTSPYVDYSATFTAGSGGGMATVSYTLDEHYPDGYAWKQSDSYTSNFASLNEFVANNFHSSYHEYWRSYWIDGQGEYEPTSFSPPDFTQSGQLEYTLIQPDVVFFDANHPLLGNVGLQFTAQFDGLPEASVSVTGNATAFEQGNATITISYDNRSLTFSGNNESASGAQASLTIQNQDGVKLVVSATEGNNTFPVTIDNVTVATVSELGDGTVRVDYIDGTFEVF